MKRFSLTQVLLFVVAMALIAIAIRPYIQPASARAASQSAYPFYIEPGVQLLRKPDGTLNVYGKVVIDMRSGAIWGFPTGTLDPYPSNSLQDKPVTTSPIELGRFAFEETDRSK
ncbi:MAG: hypothetical protein JWM43_1588 [Acidobacteriaceae bacterium]|nr:hypothetical protein [Acidobacteriaceae bacterium]